jgi:hypothetical protein
MVVGNDGGVTYLAYDSVSNAYKVYDVSKGLEIGRITNVSGVSGDNYGFANWDNSCRWVNNNSRAYKFFDLFGNESTVFELTDGALLDGSAGPTNAILYTYDTSFKLTQREYYSGDFFTFIPGTSRFLYVNGTQLHRVNYGGSRSTDSIVLRHPQGDKYFLQPRVAPGNNNVIYTATQQQGAYYHFQVFKSDNGGSTWTEFNRQPYGGFLTDIAISPDNPEYVCVGSASGEVYFSRNSGLEFENSMLPPEAGAVNTLTYMDGRHLLAACDNGLWVCRTNVIGEKVWWKFNDLLPRKTQKLPDCRITDVEYLPALKLVRAATMGRGLFECDVKKLL